MQEFLLNGRAIRWDSLPRVEAQTAEEEYTLSFLREWTSGNSIITLYTSGTTGSPQPITFRREQLVASARKTLNYFQLAAGTPVLNPLSSRFIAGKMMLVRAQIGDLDLEIVDATATPLKMAQRLPHFTAMVPYQIRQTLATTPESYGQISAVLAGGASMEQPLRQSLEPFGNTYETFGMTETLTHIAIRRVVADEPEGFAMLPGVACGTFEDGRLWFEVDFLDARVVSQDLGAMRSGRLHWYGRADYVINSGGIKLHPEVLEARITALVPMPFFIGKQVDSSFGEVPVLVIESATGEYPIDLLERVNFGLGPFEQLRGIWVCREFDRTISGKIRRLQSIENHRIFPS